MIPIVYILIKGARKLLHRVNESLHLYICHLKCLGQRGCFPVKHFDSCFHQVHLQLWLHHINFTLNLINRENDSFSFVIWLLWLFVTLLPFSFFSKLVGQKILLPLSSSVVFLEYFVEFLKFNRKNAIVENGHKYSSWLPCFYLLLEELFLLLKDWDVDWRIWDVFCFINFQVGLDYWF